MRRIIVSAVSIAAAVLLSGCAKEVTSKVNEAEKRYFDAWMTVNHPDAKPTGLGIYIIEEEVGDGAEVKEGGFAFIDYIISDLEGNISSYTGKETAKQLGDYDTTYFYGAKVQPTAEGTLAAGVSEALIGMKVGGNRKVIIPSWLMTYYRYDTAEEYLNKSTGGNDAIYDIRVEGYTEDITEWQIEKIGEYFAENQDIFEGMTAADSLKGHTGFYYKQLNPPVGVTDSTAFPTDTSIYINYTGKLLNGLVFDTTDERVAKDNGIWSPSKTYEPMQITWGEEYTNIQMGTSGSSVIDGFALTLWQMQDFEKGIGVFTSEYGYGTSGSGKSIPGYAPLVFEIEIVAKPED